MKGFTRVSFAEIKDRVPKGPGIYKIYTSDHKPLKVGIAANLQKRLTQHRDSRQKYLQLKPGGSWANPADVVSKRSILAKHLFFASRKLRTELGRQQFLLRECYVLFLPTSTRAEAREMERQIEREGRFLYVGRPATSVRQRVRRPPVTARARGS